LASAEFLPDAVGGRFDLLAIGLGADGERPDNHLLEFLSRRLQATLVARRQRHVGTFLSEAPGNGPADAGGGTRDDDHGKRLRGFFMMSVPGTRGDGSSSAPGKEAPVGLRLDWE